MLPLSQLEQVSLLLWQLTMLQLEDTSAYREPCSIPSISPTPSPLSRWPTTSRKLPDRMSTQAMKREELEIRSLEPGGTFLAQQGDSSLLGQGQTPLQVRGWDPE